eukprot:scaffold395_cov243-Pinguiococcus_pyrenoidosus.AAC.37
MGRARLLCSGRRQLGMILRRGSVARGRLRSAGAGRVLSLPLVHCRIEIAAAQQLDGNRSTGGADLRLRDTARTRCLHAMAREEEEVRIQSASRRCPVQIGHTSRQRGAEVRAEIRAGEHEFDCCKACLRNAHVSSCSSFRGAAANEPELGRGSHAERVRAVGAERERRQSRWGADSLHGPEAPGCPHEPEVLARNVLHNPTP